MTTKVSEIIVDALEDLVVQADEADIEPSEAKAAIRALNRMMAQYASKGVNLGYTYVNSLDDLITVPDGAMDGIVANLAVRLAPKYIQGAIPDTLISAASRGEDTLYHIAIEVPEASFSSNTPRGSGNEGAYSDVDPFFYGDEAAILSEQNGTISLEDSTEEA